MHPVQHLRICLGTHPNLADLNNLLGEAVQICGVAAANSEPGGRTGACVSCGFSPDGPFAESTCPFPTLYWDFLLRHGSRVATDPKLAGPMSALAGLSPGARAGIRSRAMGIRLNSGHRPAATDIKPIA